MPYGRIHGHNHLVCTDVVDPAQGYLKGHGRVFRPHGPAWRDPYTRNEIPVALIAHGQLDAGAERVWGGTTAGGLACSLMRTLERCLLWCLGPRCPAGLRYRRQTAYARAGQRGAYQKMLRTTICHMCGLMPARQRDVAVACRIACQQIGSTTNWRL